MPTRTLKTAVKDLRKEQGLTLQELALRIESDTSHVYKILQGRDVTLSTILKLAAALEVDLMFGPYKLKMDPTVSVRRRKSSG